MEMHDQVINMVNELATRLW